jgi:hypothetical protein
MTPDRVTRPAGRASQTARNCAGRRGDAPRNCVSPRGQRQRSAPYRSHTVSARLMGEFGEPECLQQGRQVHPEPAAIAVTQAIPATDRIVRGSSPCLDSARHGRFFLIRGAERHPVTVPGQPGMQVLDGLEAILQRGGAHVADESGSPPSSLYMVYGEVPGGVVSTHGSCFVPSLIGCLLSRSRPVSRPRPGNAAAASASRPDCARAILRPRYPAAPSHGARFRYERRHPGR